MRIKKIMRIKSKRRNQKPKGRNKTVKPSKTYMEGVSHISSYNRN